jgi:hypothetical protein
MLDSPSPGKPPASEVNTREARLGFQIRAGRAGRVRASVHNISVVVRLHAWMDETLSIDHVTTEADRRIIAAIE